MKKTLISFLTASALLYSAALPAQAAEEESTLLGTATRDGVIYSIYQDHAVVTGTLDDLTGDVTVLSDVDGLPVTEVGWHAFYNVGVQSVTLPGSVTVIRQNSFVYCDSLTEVTVSEGTTTLEFHPWQLCPKLETLHLPASLESLQGRIYTTCPSLHTVDLAAGNETFTVQDDLFCDKDVTVVYQLLDKSRTQVDVPETVTKLLEYSFQEADQLESVSLPGVEIIDLCAFDKCTALHTVEFSDKLRTLATGAFCDCTSLKEVTLPSSIGYLAGQSFARSGLQRITIPSATCRLNDDMADTFSSADTTVVYGVEGSDIEAYADKFGYRFLPVGTDYRLGDVNEDGKINANDASMTLMEAARIGAKRGSMLTRAQGYAADVTWDNAINANDAVYILKYAAYTGAKGTDDFETYLGR